MQTKGVVVLIVILGLLFLLGFNFTGLFVGEISVSIGTFLEVVYDEFISYGHTTKFNNLNYSGKQNISNLTLATREGKIRFTENINLTNVTGNIVNLDLYTNVSFNRIEVNSTGMPILNKSARLYFYNLTFSNPKILRNGVDCPAAICTEVDYSGGVFIFDVTAFTAYTVYSSDETSTNGGVPPGGGSGGGTPPTSDFSLSKDLIKINIKQGETSRRIIQISNIGTKTLNFVINSTLDYLMVISEESFQLVRGETKKINIDIFARENEIPEAYIGKISVTGGSITKVINTIIEVKERKPFFDMFLKLKSKEVGPGEEIEAEINLINMGDLRNIDVLVYYAIKDFDGDVLIFKEESVFVGEDPVFLERKLELPIETPFGAYVFYSELSYEDVTASSAEAFIVKESAPFPIFPKMNLLNWVILVLLGLLMLTSFWVISKKGKKK